MPSLSAQVMLEPLKKARKPASLAIAEYDRAGNLKAKFIESAPRAGPARVDILLPTIRKKPWRKVLDIFLPDGYPHSVTDDYAAYQIYDSFQAFAGTIAGMISSRAVWEGMGKDASQETAISLMGMLTGTLVVSCLTTPTTTWTTLFILIAIYLFLNWKGVRAVKSRSLNRQRANIAFSALLSKDQVLTPGKISEKELIFERRGGEVFRWNADTILGHCKFGVPLESMLQPLANGQQNMRSFQLPTVDLSNLMELFENQHYIMWCQISEAANYDAASRIKVLVVLKNGVSAKSQLKAWFHGLLLAERLHGLKTAELRRAQLGQHIMLGHIQATMALADEKYEGYARRLSAAGWNLEVAVLETRSGSRIMREVDDEDTH
ncbi:RUS1 family protein-like protein [Colletotrichum sp. SAR11_57]|nr:RUS1 family protein-like protein [Colletotrichum sp. SAR11_57]